MTRSVPTPPTEAPSPSLSPPASPRELTPAAARRAWREQFRWAALWLIMPPGKPGKAMAMSFVDVSGVGGVGGVGA